MDFWTIFWAAWAWKLGGVAIAITLIIVAALLIRLGGGNHRRRF